MSRAVTVLWEDQSAEGALPRFGPHELVIALVADEVGQSADALRAAMDVHPANGASKLLAKCAQEVGENIASDCHPVIAVFDKDRVRQLRHRTCLPNGIPAGATDDEIRTTLAKLCSAPGKLRIALLDRNVETLLAAVREIWTDDSSTHATQYDEAIRHKSRNDRDAILGRLARLAGGRQVRLDVATRVPGLKELRDEVIRAFGREDLRTPQG